jgi:hypothetical protein
MVVASARLVPRDRRAGDFQAYDECKVVIQKWAQAAHLISSFSYFARELGFNLS